MTESEPYVHCGNTTLVTVVRNSYAHVQSGLCMPTVLKSDAKILNSLKL